MQQTERSRHTGNGTSQPTGAASSSAKEFAGKYLTFVMASGEYGLAVRKVREIIKLPPITAVPQMASAVKGVINLRGKVIPVIDLRLKFDVPASDYTDRTCIIVVDVELRTSTMLMGIIVDSVSDVVSVADHELADPPAVGERMAGGYVDALAKVKGTVKILLNVDRVCAPDPDAGRLAPAVIAS